jgi:hypothetical protein
MPLTLTKANLVINNEILLVVITILKISKIQTTNKLNSRPRRINKSKLNTMLILAFIYCFTAVLDN